MGGHQAQQSSSEELCVGKELTGQCTGKWKVGGVKAGDRSAASLHSAGLSGKSQLFIGGGKDEARLGGGAGEQGAALRNSKCKTLH